MEEGIVLVHQDTKGIGGSSLTQGDDFSSGIKSGDYFYLTYGNLPLLIGRIVSESKLTDFKDFGANGWLERKFDSILESENPFRYENERRKWSPNYNSTCTEIGESELDNANDWLLQPHFNVIVKSKGDSNEVSSNKHMSQPLNQILYGPPGTGKTYNTINQAISICNPEFDLNTTRDEVRDEYLRLQNEGQIVFTTFHQSLSYEDFIEGLKPLEPKREGDNIIYKVQNGLFKDLSNQAFMALVSPDLKSEESETTSFDDVYEKYLDTIRPEAGSNNTVFKSLYDHDLLLLDIKGTSIIVKFRWYNKSEGIPAKQPFSVTKTKIKQLYDGGLNPSTVRSLKESFKPYFQHNTSMYFAVYRSFYEFMENNGSTSTEVINEGTSSFEELMDLWNMEENQEQKTEDAKKYVLVIDEINRGNVSQIFGELITLIEEDKRIAKSESLEVILPYSKERFAVPPNLYIIGTMNTADRSVEAIDAALRRRFQFTHMPADSSLLTQDGNEVMIEDISLKALLDTINERVTYLKDADHEIGHSYLLHVSTLEELETTFNKNIIPLLKEYFYNDFGKIRLILGEGFVELKSDGKPKFAVDDDDEYQDDVFRFLHPAGEEFLEAIRLTLG